MEKIKNLQIVLNDRVIPNGYICFENGIIKEIGEGFLDDKNAIDGCGLIAMPGFVDVHIHGSCGIDFMDAKVEDYKTISEALYKEGVTTYLATTLTSDHDSLKKVCENVNEARKDNPSLAGIHFEGPYINEKYKGAQNEAFIRDPDTNEIIELQNISGNNIRYITMAPEKFGALPFIRVCRELGITVSAGHSDATYENIKEAIKYGLTNTTHTHNAMSGHHHRNPGIVTAAFYFDKLNTEFICDGIHVCKDALKASYRIIGPERFFVVTDALKAKHSEIEEFDLFGLPCIKKDGAAYLKSGPLAGSLLTMDQAARNMYEFCKLNLFDLAKICSRNAARSLHLDDRGEIKVGKIADLVLLDNSLQIKHVYKLGKEIF